MDAGVFGVESETDGRIAPVARKIGKKCPNSYQKRQKYAQKHFRNIKPDRLLAQAVALDEGRYAKDFSA
jgi:hypothetical protein